MLSDDDLRSMGTQDREDLLRRLIQVAGDVSLVSGRAQRERFVAITAGAAIFLLVWIVYLGPTQPVIGD
jgi:type II secretory pathway component PulM